MVIVIRSGLDVGLGIVTLGLGVGLAVAGFDAFRRGGWSPVWALSAAMAAAALVVVAVFLARTYVFADFLMYGPGGGVYLVVTGAVVALVSAVRLRVPGRAASRLA